MAGTGTKRITELTEASTVQSGDFIAVDSNARGTKKVSTDTLATSAALTAETNARAGADEQMSERMDGIEEQTALIQNPTKTLSGALCSFTDGADMPMVACTAEIVPKQAGTGTPSPDNVRPISGWESVSVYKSGKNLLNPNIESKTASGVTYSYSDGGILLNGTKVGNNTANLTSVVTDFPAGTYTFSGSLVSGTIKKDNANYNNITAYLIDEGGNATSIGQLFESKTITLSESIRAYLRLTTWSDNVIFTNALVYLQLELGTTATEYEPYTGATTTTPLGRTVYGGTLDVVSGVLTVDKGFVTFDGSSDETWFNNGSAGVYTPKASLPNVKPIWSGVTILSNQYTQAVSGQATTVNGKFNWNDNMNALQFRNDNALNATDFRAALAQNPVTIVYPLETPQTYQLTPTEVKTLLGENNVWADSGDVEITYRRDISIVINNLESALNG